MNIKGSELQQATNALMRIMTKPMQFKFTYRLTRTADKLQSAFKDLDKRRIVLVKEFGVKDEAKGTVSVPPDKIEIFQAAFDKILAETIVIDIDPIPLDLLKEANIDISAVDLVAIDKFIGKE
jgi:hypothetical protein